MKPLQTILTASHAQDVTERLIRYARIETTSSRNNEAIPSSESQWTLAKLLVEELKALGVTDVTLDEHCFVIAKIPASPGYENKPAIGFMAHVDTVADVSGTNVNPRIITDYDGSAIKLNERLVLDPAEFPELLNYKHDSLIVTDGNTLLGADDKAGVAAIMSAVKLLMEQKDVPHGPLYAIFTPDEETGRGMNAFPIDKVSMQACYTFDGGPAGEIEAECFNAYGVKVTFTGKPSHPGYARGVMANAASMAAHFASLLPRSESPEATDGWFGYYYILEIHGELEHAELQILLRDFSDDGMQKRIKTLEHIAHVIEDQYPGGKVHIETKEQYRNMKHKLLEAPKALEYLEQAMRNAGLEPHYKPIRGGTDGARLTQMGIPTPNIFAGMHNFHSQLEWASVAEMTLAVDVILELAKLWAQ
ncbi:MAG TPA: peptidase T [Spirochaetales bacterium]|nr:peptidase T [Spirochaetales bacterium]